MFKNSILFSWNNLCWKNKIENENDYEWMAFNIKWQDQKERKTIYFLSTECIYKNLFIGSDIWEGEGTICMANSLSVNLWSHSYSLFRADRQETRQKIGTTIASNNFSNWSRPSWDLALLYLCLISVVPTTFWTSFGILAITPLFLLSYYTNTKHIHNYIWEWDGFSIMWKIILGLKFGHTTITIQ